MISPSPLPNLMASLVALFHSIISGFVYLTHSLDNQSPLTNVLKLFRVVYRLCRTIYNGFIVACQRLLRELPRQIQKIVEALPRQMFF